MADPGMAEMFLRAHTLLGGIQDDLMELHEAGVGLERILALYPYDFTEWLPVLAAIAPDEPENHNLVQRLHDIQSEFRALPLQPTTAWRVKMGQRVSEWSRTEFEDDLYAVLRGSAGEITYGELHDRQLDFVASYLMIELAASWHAFPLLHRYEAEYARLLHKAFGALLPNFFPTESSRAVQTSPSHLLRWSAGIRIEMKRVL